MEQFIKSLENLDQKPSVKIEEDGYQLGITFIAKVSKGSFTQNFRWHCDVYTSIYEGYYNVEIVDCYPEESFIGGLKVDDLGKLKSKLVEWGFEGVAHKLEIDDKDVDKALYEKVKASPTTKHLFKGLKLFSASPVKERVIAQLKYKIKVDKTSMWFSEEEKELMPTDFAKKYNEKTLSIQDLKDWLNELEG